MSAAIYELDALVLAMSALTVYHAFSDKDRLSIALLIASGLLGFCTEYASIHFGGTHCHATGFLNFGEWSSVNSVFYYVPWVYVCIVSAKRLGGSSSNFAFPFMAGMLFFGMCGVYEMQGPLMKWWLWPDASGLVKGGADVWQLTPDTRGLVSTPHVIDALYERWHSFPVMAPFFHSAFGWGIATALMYTVPAFGAKFKLGKVMGAVAVLSSVLTGPSLAMAWDGVMRVFTNTLGLDRFVGVPVMMLLSFVLPMLVSPPQAGKYTGPRDAILFMVPLLNALFFNANCLFRAGKDIIPKELKLLVLAVSIVSLSLHARAAGLIVSTGKGKGGGKKTVTAPQAPTRKSTRHKR